ADLETICLKCLQKEPSKRYSSALALAEDLQRFLENRPIQARRIRFPERCWKWAKRRPAVAALLAILAAIVGVSLAALTGLWASAENQRDLAQTREQEATEQRSEAERQKTRAETSYNLARGALDKIVRLKDEPRFQQGPLEDIRRSILTAEAGFY